MRKLLTTFSTELALLEWRGVHTRRKQRLSPVDVGDLVSLLSLVRMVQSTGECFLGRKDRDEDWYVNDARTGEKVYVGPVPEHLFYAAETKEECMVMIAKLCMRANDTAKGRAIKLVNYIDLHKRYYGVFPDDIHLFVRTMADIPITMKDEILKVLETNNWKEKTIPDPTLLSKNGQGEEGIEMAMAEPWQTAEIRWSSEGLSHNEARGRGSADK